MNAELNQFNPDYAVHPGEILEERIEALGIKKREFAERCGMSFKNLSQILNGKAPVTAETAIQFERVLGSSAAFWNNLNSNYELQKARIKDEKSILSQIKWAHKFPIAEMIKRNWIQKPVNNTDLVNKLLSLLGLGSVKAWDDFFAKETVRYKSSPSFQKSPEPVSVWLKMGELKSAEIKTNIYNKDLFESNLKKIRELTNQSVDVFEPEMKRLCSEAGVALVFIPELKGTHLSGATKWITKDKALIILSLRHKINDHLWFAFFHEAAHILKHSKKETFIDEKNHSTEQEEIEADTFSANILINNSEYKRFIDNHDFSRNSILNFSKSINIAPGIVVGRLQHEGMLFHYSLNDLKIKLDFKSHI